jgi:hypothetical protein
MPSSRNRVLTSNFVLQHVFEQEKCQFFIEYNMVKIFIYLKDCNKKRKKPERKFHVLEKNFQKMKA